jgi:hypothetical protein
MRAIFGLVGILIAIGVLVYFLGPGGGLTHTQQVLEQGEKARHQAEQLAGRDASGMRVQDSITLDPQTSGGRLNSILVTDIVADGPMARYYGLKRNDSIIQVGPMQVRDFSDPSMAKDMIYESYQRQQQLVIVRNGQQLTLPQQPANNAPAPQPSNPEPPPSDRPLDRQLRGIGVPTH